MNFSILLNSKNLSLGILVKIKLGIISLILIAFGFNLFFVNSAQALIRKQQESPETILYQSRHSLRDQRGQSWQVVLFKRVEEQETKQVHLRVIGFPNQASFEHPQPLEIKTPNNINFKAVDQFYEKAPAPNVGEYDLQDILPELLTYQKLELTLPLQVRSQSLTIPYPVILEWQDMNQS